MSLTDLMNEHYTRAVREAKLDVIRNRSDNIVKAGDLVEMLLGISFGVKDSMLSWEWLGIDPKEWPPQRLDWEMYRLEHLAFASNMEEQMIGWINYPWHVLYSALRCMAYRDWKRQHSCPICRTFNRNSGSSHDAWAFFDGCLSHLDTAPKCIGNLLLEDTLNGRGLSLIPSVASLLEELSPRKRARDWLPSLTILYMAPGGHKQWPMSIKPLLDRLSWIVMITRPLALTRLQDALRANTGWRPKYRRGPSVDLVPAVPYKFLDIGTRMGCYHIKELISKQDDKSNILHPRFAGAGIPPIGTFHSVVQNRVGDNHHIDQWCVDDAWFKASPCHDFWVNDTSKYRWGLPVIVPTCPRKMFAGGPRLKYVDIVTDTLHASSSDLIVWNTLVLIKLRWISEIPKEWVDITYNSLEAWSNRDQLSPFHNDNRRGYARVTPLALSSCGIPDSSVQEMGLYPSHGLGIYDDYEICEDFHDYVWASWTTKEAQPMQVDPALQVLIDRSKQRLAPDYDQGTSASSDMTNKPMSGGVAASGNVAPPFPTSSEDVSMESTADKRSRESPDSTLKPEGKSLKTSESTSATSASGDVSATGASAGDSMKPVSASKRPKTPRKPEVSCRRCTNTCLRGRQRS